MFEQGKSGYQIAQDMNLHARTVNRIIKRYQETGSYSDRQRSGRPHNPQNDRDWSEEPLPLEERVVSRTQKPKQVMV